jgi:tripartite-type tricarboxylate transporter receptor subunit TctC
MGPTCRVALIAALLICFAPPSRAQQSYPSKPIHIVVPYAAGGSVDPIARLVGDRLAKVIGQPVVIENRPGAGGNIGIEAVVRGAHDGYTLLATPSAVTINPSLYAKVPYDLERDLVPIGLVNRNAMVVLVNPSWGMMYGWSMLFAPAGVPRPIVEALHDDIARVVAQPDVAKIIADLGSEPQALSLDELKDYVRREAAYFAGIVKASGARID